MKDLALHILMELYGEALGAATYELLERLLMAYPSRIAKKLPRGGALGERDAILITYGDQVQEPGKPGLQTLAEFCQARLGGVVSGVHILPFYPYSSDDGFSVVDYKAVDPALGSWQDVARLGEDFRLMFDAVINHISAQSAWFQAFLRGDLHYQDYFITVAGEPDLSQVVRPRALPLLTRFDTPMGQKAVWTTFSADQIDLNYAHPEVLLEVIDVLLFYAAQGAELIRLDAIAYLWKEIGTTCIHLRQTHLVIQLIRAVLDRVAPQVLLITETNVPHEDNISYFGDGRNEAQLVYNFALPPLALHTLRTGNAQALAQWASSLALPSKEVTFFNFLASHDGIGLNPARGILSEAEIKALVNGAQAHGGLVSYKHNPDGTSSPYELNINYFDALSNPNGGEPLERQADRFIVSQAIMLALTGVPGIYFQSLFGSRGWPEGVQQSGQNRTINRQKLSRAVLETEINTPGHLRNLVFQQYARLLKARAARAAFNPFGEQQVLDCGEAVFGLLRYGSGSGGRVLCLHNVSDRSQTIPETTWIRADDRAKRWVDIVNHKPVTRSKGRVILRPYQVLWLSEDEATHPYMKHRIENRGALATGTAPRPDG
jgi:glucosylglycerate phosphorylase